MSLVVFARHLARVKLRDPQWSQHPSRLVIVEPHGRAGDVGRFLTEDERQDLASRLRIVVGKASK
jgi:uncharacterized membrane protein